jgi:molybdate transport system permease protein
LSDVLDPLAVSLRVAFLTTILVLPPGTLLGWWLARSGLRWKWVVESIILLPLVLPPTAVGYVILDLFAADGLLGRDRLGFDPGLLLTWKGAVLAAVVMSLPLVARTARVAFDGVDTRLEGMARTLGLGPLACFFRVTVPLAWRGLLAAAVLGFSRALGEFGATVIVAGSIPGKTETLALAIFSGIRAGREDQARSLLLVSVLLAFAGIFISEMLMRRRGPDGSGEIP